MKLLAFDSAVEACSVCLWDGGAARARHFERMARGQSEKLVPMISRLMDNARLSFGDLDAIVVTVGPGAFTGVRIGLATAEGIALASGLPLYGVSTLESLAHAGTVENGAAWILSAVEAGCGELYVQLFVSPSNTGGALSIMAAPASLPLAGIGDYVFSALPENFTEMKMGMKIIGARAGMIVRALGESPRFVSADLQACEMLPDAFHVASLAAGKIEKGGQDEMRPAALYIRPHYAQKPQAPLKSS